MFKKLFISLLILSALASEGIVNFPVNFYNLYLADSNNRGFYAESQQHFQKQLNNETELSGGYPASSEAAGDGLFVLSFSTNSYLAQFRQIGYDCPDCVLRAQDCGIPDPQSAYVPWEEAPAALYNKDRIILSSDNSPPIHL